MSGIKVLITGAAGLVGSYLCEICLEAGYKVTGIDNFFRGSIQNLKNALHSSKFKFIEGDILNGPAIPGGGFDCVFHLAAVVATKFFYEGVIDTFETNCRGTKIMLDWSAENGVKKFINASSSEIYGHAQKIPTDELTPAYFDAVEITPRWSYALGKMLGEHIANSYSRRFKVCHLRYANIYGPRDIDENHIIPYLLKNIHENRKIIVNKNADHIRRSFLYATDAAIAAFQAAINGAGCGEAYNIGSIEEISINDLIQKAFQICSKKVEIEYSLERSGDPARRLLDITRAKEKLGFIPEVNLDYGMRKTYEAIITSGK